MGLSKDEIRLSSVEEGEKKCTPIHLYQKKSKQKTSLNKRESGEMKRSEFLQISIVKKKKEENFLIIIEPTNFDSSWKNKIIIIYE